MAGAVTLGAYVMILLIQGELREHLWVLLVGLAGVSLAVILAYAKARKVPK